MDDVLIIDHVINYGCSLLLGAFGGGFQWGKMYSGSIIVVIIHSII